MIQHCQRISWKYFILNVKFSSFFFLKNGYLKLIIKQ